MHARTRAHTVYIHFIHTCRNEQFQEELWSISCDLLKDWMSPEIHSKYTKGGDDGKSPVEVAAVDDNKSTDDKQPQGQQPS